MFVADRGFPRRHAPAVFSSADLLAALRSLKEEGRTTNADLGRLLGLPSSRIAEIYDGKRKVTVDEAKVIVDHFGLAAERALPAASHDPGELSDDDLDMVGIRMIDMAYGMGATYAVDYPEVDVLKFPKQWIEAISHAPPAMLTWARGRGDSMDPTIRDGDLVLLDQSQRTLTERDAMWAFTIGEEAAIKRLRRQGDRCQIFSDNPTVPPDEQLLRDIHIVGRVVFVGARK